MIDIYGRDLSKPIMPRRTPLTEAEQTQLRLIDREIDDLHAQSRLLYHAKSRITDREPTQPMTKLELQNLTDQSVLTYLTLGATPGCVQDVGLIRVSNGVTISRLYPLQGSLILPAKTTLTFIAPAGDGFNGNFSFGTPPLNCPTPDWPEGVALAEFIINNGFQPGGQETVDISCVCGANAYIGFDLTSSDWTTNGGAIAVREIRNGKREDNTGRNGVYPYGCDDCQSSSNPPACVGQQPQNVNTLPICNVQRPASSPGGVVRVVFLGWTPVPL